MRALNRKMEIGIYYDPLLAKLIALGVDRESALRKLAYALRNLSICGVQTSRDFLIRLIENAEFREGQFDTGFIAEHLDELIAQKDEALDFACAVAASLYLQESRRTKAEILPQIPVGYRNNPYRDPSVKLQIGGDVIDISYRSIRPDVYTVSCGDRQTQVQIVSFAPDSIRLSMDGVQRQFRVTEAAHELFVHSTSGSRTLTRLPRYPRSHSASEHETANAPMPGQVLRILVSQGQQVAIGDPLIILEAMKMEQTIRASMEGVVEAVLVKLGQVVSPGDVLVEIGAGKK